MHAKSSLNRNRSIMPRVGIEPTSLAFQARVHDVGSLTSPLYPCPPVYVVLLPQRSVQTPTHIDLLYHGNAMNQATDIKR